MVDDRVAPTTLSKRALTDLCRTLEDQILAEDLEGTIIAGFQRARHFAVERARYEALTADPRRRAVVLTADADDVDDRSSRVQRVAVGEDHDLAREWFVLALTDACSAVLLGRELVATPQPEEADRQFLTIWSFDPTVVDDLTEAVLSSTSDLPPEQFAVVQDAARAVRPRVPEPLLVQRFLNAVLERLDAGQRRLTRTADDRDTARRELEAEQDRALALEWDAARSAVAGRIAQRLDAPLTAVSGAVDALTEATDPVEQQRLTGVIAAETLRTRQLASELQSLSDREPPMWEPVELVAWLEREVDDHRAQGTDVELASFPEAATLHVDVSRLRQALSSVLSEAESAPGRTLPPRVTLKVGEAGATIVVSRDGVGPEPAQLGAVRNPHERAAGTDPGTLELALAAVHLSAQGGALRLTSDGHLTSYHLQLPAAATAPDGRTDAVATGTSAAVPVASRQRSALVVDDEPAIRGLVEALLRRAGWTVYAAASASEACQCALEHHLDVVLLGLDPGDRQRLRAELDRLRPGTALRTIIITGDPTAGDEQQGCPVVRKPFVWAELSDALDVVAAREPVEGAGTAPNG